MGLHSVHPITGGERDASTVGVEALLLPCFSPHFVDQFLIIGNWES